MNKTNIKVFLKKRKQRISVFGISPMFDWWIILSLGTLLFLCGIVYAVYLYTNISKDSFFQVIEDTSQQDEFERKKANIQKKVDLLNQQNFDEIVLN